MFHLLFFVLILTELVFFFNVRMRWDRKKVLIEVFARDGALDDIQ